MRIVDIVPRFVDRFLFFEVHTDEGITGVGESGAWAYLEASAAVMETFKRYMIGQDPFRIEHHWQALYRWRHFRGAAVMGALSALDLALWDIKGKALGVPCYELLGGRTRERVRLYAHVFGADKEALVDGCLEAKARGFTAVGHLTPFLDEDRRLPYFKTHADKIGDAVRTVERYREAVGNEVDLCLEIHRRLTPAEAIALAHGIEHLHPFFIEDPIPPDSHDAMALIAQRSRVPIATGERLHTIHEFDALLRRDAVAYVRPNLGLAGGLSHVKKIAALAEAHHVGVVPHNPLGPVCTAASVQLAACIPNFAIQEYSRRELELAEGTLVTRKLELEGGFLRVPTAPGLGVELVPDAERHHPFVPREVVTRLGTDGSVVDQ